MKIMANVAMMVTILGFSLGNVAVGGVFEKNIKI